MTEKLPSVGGQAVIEGVMMRGGNLVACACSCAVAAFGLLYSRVSGQGC